MLEWPTPDGNGNWVDGNVMLGKAIWHGFQWLYAKAWGAYLVHSMRKELAHS